MKKLSAVIFDMDGTLIDSEIFTTVSVETLLKENNIECDIDTRQFEGANWAFCEGKLLEHYPSLKELPSVSERLHEIFHQCHIDNPPAFIKGARDTFIAASKKVPVAIVSSSNRESVEATIKAMDLGEHITTYLGAEDYEKSKPDPDGYLTCAKELGVSPEECIVFEDSIPGLGAGKKAGMYVIAITCRAVNLGKSKELSHETINDFTEFKTDLF